MNTKMNVKKIAKEILAETVEKKKPFISIEPAGILTEQLEEKIYRSLKTTGNFLVDSADSAVYFENSADAEKVFPEFQHELGIDHVKLIK